MAKMIPWELKDNENISNGEREVFQVLKDGLSDEWLVIYSLRWVTDDNITSNKSNGESDFLLIHPNYGILVIEVKGGFISCINGQWSSISTSNMKYPIQDPEKQANTAKHNFVKKFKNNGLNPYITTAVWFPDCNKEKCSLPLSMPKNIVLDNNSFNNIEENIINIFKYRANKEGFTINKLIDSDFKKVIDILNPKTEIKIPLVRLSDKLNMRFMKLNEEQNMFFEQLDDNKLISVVGHAGTGKTVLAVKKAFREAEDGKKVLFLCYNDLLRDKVKGESEGKFSVHNFNDLAEEYLRLFNKPYYDKYQIEGGFDQMHSQFLLALKNNRDKNKLLYDSIVVDEGQDFTKEWFEGIQELLNIDGSLCVFYDKNQMVYNKYGRTDISFLDIGTKFTLRRNLRNTDEICSSSLKVVGVNEKDIKLNGITGVTPDIIFADDSFDTMNQLKNVLTTLKSNEHLKDENITVLTVEAKKKLLFKKSISTHFKGTVESIRRYKGLENDVIIIPDLKENFMDDIDNRNLVYVGMSRAKAHVVLIVSTESLNRKQTNSFKKELKEKIL